MSASIFTGLKVWVFSGDVDGIVPVVGSRRWISSLNLPIAKPWRAWTSKTGQVSQEATAVSLLSNLLSN